MIWATEKETGSHGKELSGALPRMATAPRERSVPKVDPADILVLTQVLGRILKHDSTDLEDVPVLRYSQREAGVLLHQENGDALVLI